MAITYPLTMPSSPGFSTASFRAVNVVAVSQSPFTLKSQAVRHQGQRWEAELSLPPMRRSDAENWISFLMSLKGSFGTFMLGDPLGLTPRGFGRGTITVQGDGQTGSSLVVAGAPISMPSWLMAGDYIQIGTGLHKLMESADSDASGVVTLEIWPDINTAPADNSAVLTTGAQGLFRLAGNETSWDMQGASNYGLTFGAVGIAR